MRAKNRQHAFRRIGAFLGLTVFVALGACTTAGDLADTDPIGPLPHRYHEYFWKFEVEYRQALAGDCSGVEEVLARAPSDPPLARLTAEFEGQLYDQGLCRTYDPEAAYKAFRRAEEFRDSAGSLLRAWKLWHGDGTVRDRGAAERDFALWAIQSSIHKDPDGLYVERRRLFEFAESLLAGRSVPPPLISAANWGEVIGAMDDAEKTQFAIDIMRGKALDWKGRALPAWSAVRYYLFWNFEETYPEHFYHFGLAAVRGELSGVSWEEGETALFMATQHCIEGAYSALAKAYEVTASPENRRLEEAYETLLQGERAGFPLAEQRTRIGRLLEGWRRDLSESVMADQPVVICRE